MLPRASPACSPIKAARRAAEQPADNFRLLMSGGGGGGMAAAAPADETRSDVNHVPPEADRALLRAKEKLLGFEEGGAQLSEAGQVRYLVQAATNPEVLSQMYYGWQSWV